MNTHDADTAETLVAPDVEIVMGPHARTGRTAVREFALQEDPELVFETVPVNVEPESGTRIAVQARRTSRWRESGDVAAEEDVRVRFDFGADGLITRIELS
jgi:hypothetical protein